MSILGGLPDDISVCASQTILKYLLLILYTDCISGFLIYQYSRDKPLLRLIRCNYKAWCQQMYLRTGIISGILVGGLTVFIFLIEYDFVVLYCGIMFMIQAIFLNMIQAFCILYFKKAEAGFCVVISIQILSIFFSSTLPGQWKLVLPGNWGCFNRSNLMYAEGFSAGTAVLLEIIFILLFWFESWKLIRYKRQK